MKEESWRSNINFRDGLYLGSILGMFLYTYLLKLVDKIAVDSQIRTAAYYEQEFDTDFPEDHK